VDLGCLGYLEMAGSFYLSPYSFSWGWEDQFHSTEYTLGLEEVVVVTEEVEEACEVGVLVPEGMEH